jgi:ATP-dependent Lon protease
MGYNSERYRSEEQQMLLLARLLPIVHNRINIIELAPKGTGKSFLYSNLSRYARLLSGGKTTAAALFYNLATNEPGLLTQYDLVAFDEAKTISFDNPGEVIGVLKDYLESGRYTRGRQLATAAAGVAILGNIEIAADGKPVNRVLFREFPEFLQETAFIARFHALLPGWEIPKFSPDSVAMGIGLKADFFGEVLHSMRDLSEHGEYTQRKLVIRGSEDIRDVTAVRRVAAAYLKLLFPSLRLTDEEFYRYCASPALRLRQMVCDQLAAMDAEYPSVQLDGSVL